MKIPKGTAKAIYSETNRMYFKNFKVWLAVSSPWWVWGGATYFFYLNNFFLIEWLNAKLPVGFFIIDIFMTVTFFLVLAVSLVTTLLMFESVAGEKKEPSLKQVYGAAFKLLWPLLFLKIRYLWRILWRLPLLVVPGIFALTDGIACFFAFLCDHKQGGEAIRYSDSIVRVDRARYWDYLLMAILLPAMVLIPFILFMDQISYILRLNHLYYFSLASDGIKHVALYFSVVYSFVFHYRIYLKFKSFLPS